MLLYLLELIKRWYTVGQARWKAREYIFNVYLYFVIASLPALARTNRRQDYNPFIPS